MARQCALRKPTWPALQKRLILPCGYRHVRLQSAQGVWASEGRSVLLTCRTTTVVAIETEPNG